MNNQSLFDFGSYNFDKNCYYDRTLFGQHTNAKRNLMGLIDLINRLFEYHSRLLVVRVDLSYRTDCQTLITIDDVQKHRDLLLADRRENSKVFNGLVGYAWGLEFGEQDGGYHYHLLAIYNGAIRMDDIGIGLAICSLWAEITNYYGRTYVSNFDKKMLAQNGCLGIGMIHRSDVQMRINLIEKVAAYITKKCSIFDAESGRTESGSFRNFGRSWMPRALDITRPRRGRPPTLFN